MWPIVDHWKILPLALDSVINEMRHLKRKKKSQWTKIENSIQKLTSYNWKMLQNSWTFWFGFVINNQNHKLFELCTLNGIIQGQLQISLAVLGLFNMDHSVYRRVEELRNLKIMMMYVISLWRSLFVTKVLLEQKNGRSFLPVRHILAVKMFGVT